MDFSSSFYSHKRSTLIFSAVGLVFCAPGVQTSSLEALGVSFSGLPFQTLTAFLFVAASYYFALFGSSAYVEGKTSLLSQENNVVDLKRLLEESLQRLERTIEDFQPILKTAAAGFDEQRFPKALEGLERIVRDGQIVVHSKEEAVGNPHGLGNVSASTFNAISSWFQEFRQRSSRQSEPYPPDEMRMEVLKGLRQDLVPMVDRAAKQAVEESWRPLKENLVAANATMGDFVASFKSEIARHDQNLTAYREPLRAALFEIRLIGSVRSFQFWVLEVGGPFVLYAVFSRTFWESISLCFPVTYSFANSSRAVSAAKGYCCAPTNALLKPR